MNMPDQNSIERLQDRVRELEDDNERHARFIASRGYRRCDIMACNCNSWHGGHANDRLREICDALQPEMQGSIAVDAIGVMRARIAELEAARKDALLGMAEWCATQDVYEPPSMKQIAAECHRRAEEVA